MQATRKKKPTGRQNDNARLVAAVDRYNASGDSADLFAIWADIQTAAVKIVNKRLAGTGDRRRDEKAEEVALKFFERLKRHRDRGTPYQPRKVYTVLYNISTFVLYDDKTKQIDREVPSDPLAE